MSKYTLPAGNYYIGDLCYVLKDEWNEVCDLTEDGAQGVFTLKSGRKFAISNTKYGDGGYPTTLCEQELSVDSGTIGATLAEGLCLNDMDLGVEHEFKEPFQFLPVDQQGVIVFGEHRVYTDDDFSEEGSQ